MNAKRFMISIKKIGQNYVNRNTTKEVYIN